MKFIEDPRRLFAAAFLLCLLHALLRLLFTFAADVDHVEQLVLAQELQAFYGPRQPPLYTWLMWLIEQPAGPSRALAMGLKYALFLAAGCSYWLAMRQLGATRREAGFGILCLFLLYQIVWKMHHGVTHTALLCLACAATLATFARLRHAPSRAAFLLAASAVALGALSKHAWWAFLAALLVACSMDATLRARLYSRPARWLWLPALAVVLPYLAGLVMLSGSLQAEYTATVGSAAEAGSALAARLQGSVSLALAVAGFLSFLLLPMLVAPLLPRTPASGAARPAAEPDGANFRATPPAAPEPEPEPAKGEAATSAPASSRAAPCNTDDDTRQAGRRLLFRLNLALAAILLAMVLLGGATRFVERWLHPFLLWLPMAWVMSQGDAGRLQAGRPLARLLLAWAGLLIGVSLGWQAVQDIHGPPTCGKCRSLVDHAPLARALADAGLDAADILASDEHLAANLRLRMPSARLRVPAYAQGGLEHRPGQPCVLAWDLTLGQAPPASLLASAGAWCGEGTAGAIHAVKAPLDALQARWPGWARTLPPPDEDAGYGFAFSLLSPGAPSASSANASSDSAAMAESRR